MGTNIPKQPSVPKMPSYNSVKSELDLISREATLEAFADYVAHGMSMNDYDALEDIVIHMPSISTEKTGRWIPVEDRLPEAGIYLVTVERIDGVPRIETKAFSKDLNRVDDFSFRKHKCGWYDYDSEYGYWEDASVIAWMPLPQPYEPQESEG